MSRGRKRGLGRATGVEGRHEEEVEVKGGGGGGADCNAFSLPPDEEVENDIQQEVSVDKEIPNKERILPSM
eukprot:764301-Hanusia_phi.AAC.1